MTGRRDIQLDAAMSEGGGSFGRAVIAVIGIDRYEGWQRLTNAVDDARGVLALFVRLGFEQIAEPLLDGRATGKAIQELVTDDLRTLGPDDSLVLFYAGHGSTREHRIGSQVVKTGYLIPVDASDKAATWIELDSWLRAVSRLPAKHILVILDACHTGIALGPIIKWRDCGTWQSTPLSTLKARRSRRIITSALDDQVALDSGPVYGHSLFTGCLLEGLTHDLGREGSPVTTGSELGLYLQRRVETYPDSRQTPDFGTFDFDDRGELVISLVVERPQLAAAATDAPASTAELPPSSMGPAPASPAESASRRRALDRILFSSLLVGSGIAIAQISRQCHRSNEPDAPVVAQMSHSPETSSGGCPGGMVRVPAGTFLMGNREGEGDTDELPQREVKLSGYCIDQTEVTVAAYEACAAAGDCGPAPLTVSWNGYSNEDVKIYSRGCNGADRPRHPMNCVDWQLAEAYCKWAGKRLPTEAEWEYAARGSDGRRYPWGHQAPSAKRLNACGSECVAMAKGKLEAEWKAMFDGNDGWAGTAPVGGYPEGASPFGALDMAGNVWEWTADWYGLYTPAVTTDPRGPKTGEYRVARGGGWNNVDAGRVRAAVRSWIEPADRFSGTGFRCVRGD